jgi:hypothetical protein
MAGTECKKAGYAPSYAVNSTSAVGLSCVKVSTSAKGAAMKLTP